MRSRNRHLRPGLATGVGCPFVAGLIGAAAGRPSAREPVGSRRSRIGAPSRTTSQQSQRRRFMPHAAHAAVPASPQAGPHPATVAKAAFHATCGAFRRSCVAPGGTAPRNSHKGGVSCHLRHIPPILRQPRRTAPRNSHKRGVSCHMRHIPPILRQPPKRLVNEALAPVLSEVTTQT